MLGWNSVITSPGLVPSMDQGVMFEVNWTKSEQGIVQYKALATMKSINNEG